jgi:cob(I)alamin adenosyltransferase
MKIYTRTGDTGETALFGGGRVSKAHPRVRAYGTLDELNAFVGRALASLGEGAIRERLSRVQHDLFALGAVLATPPPTGARRRPDVPDLPTDRIAEMETWMDEADRELQPLRNFILPGGTPAAADLHLCRTVCRRAEREVVEVAEDDPDAARLIRYLNRLSDLLFVFARLENHRAGEEDVIWRKEGSEGGGHGEPDE